MLWIMAGSSAPARAKSVQQVAASTREMAAASDQVAASMAEMGASIRQVTGDGDALANTVTEGTTSERDFVESYVEGGNGNVVIGTPDDAIEYIEGHAKKK